MGVDLAAKLLLLMRVMICIGPQPGCRDLVTVTAELEVSLARPVDGYAVTK